MTGLSRDQRVPTGSKRSLQAENVSVKLKILEDDPSERTKAMKVIAINTEK